LINLENIEFVKDFEVVFLRQIQRSLKLCFIFLIEGFGGRIMFNLRVIDIYESKV
jgi:hypothetical protein